MMNKYLTHHGIKGMHWGVRRFQNDDGSLTSSGKKRYSEKEVKEASDKAKEMANEIDSYVKKNHKSLYKRAGKDLSYKETINYAAEKDSKLKTMVDESNKQAYKLDNMIKNMETKYASEPATFKSQAKADAIGIGAAAVASLAIMGAGISVAKLRGL